VILISGSGLDPLIALPIPRSNANPSSTLKIRPNNISLGSPAKFEWEFVLPMSSPTIISFFVRTDSNPKF